MLWYLGFSTRHLLMGHKLLVTDNNYQNTELRGVDCLSVATRMLGCVVLYDINCSKDDNT